MQTKFNYLDDFIAALICGADFYVCEISSKCLSNAKDEWHRSINVTKSNLVAAHSGQESALIIWKTADSHDTMSRGALVHGAWAASLTRWGQRHSVVTVENRSLSRTMIDLISAVVLMDDPMAHTYMPCNQGNVNLLLMKSHYIQLIINEVMAIHCNHPACSWGTTR